MSCNQVNAIRDLISSIYEIDLQPEFSKRTTGDMNYYN